MRKQEQGGSSRPHNKKNGVKAHPLGRARRDTRAQLKRLYINRKRGKKMTDENKQAVEKLRRLVNTNFKDNSIKLELSYKPKTETSLLTVNK